MLGGMALLHAPLSVRGARIVDAAGNPVRLAGVNWGGAHQDDGDAFAPAVARRHAGGDEHVGAAQFRGDLRPRARAQQLDVILQPGGRDPGRQHLAVLAVADQPAVEARPARGEQPAGLDEVRLALDRVQRPDADDLQ